MYTVNESSGQVTLSLMKIGASDIIISVYITVYPDTAIGNFVELTMITVRLSFVTLSTAFSDYNIMLQSHEVYFHPNEHQKLFTIHLIDDQIRESSERFLVELSQSNSTYGVILEQNETSVIIIDEDSKHFIEQKIQKKHCFLAYFLSCSHFHYSCCFTLGVNRLYCV